MLDETSAPSGGKDFKIFAIGRGGPSVVPPSVPPVLAGSVTWSPSDAGVPNPVSVLDQNSLFARSLTDIGDTSRLKEVMEKAELIKIDFTGMGFSLDSNIDLGEAGCGSCGCL